MTLEETLREGAALLDRSESAMLDARVLLKHAAGFDDAALILRSKDDISSGIRARFFELIERRKTGEPVAYITGVKEFWSLDFHVTPDVLIPRDDSECLIDAVLHRRDRKDAWSILDMGVGSGCLLCALLHEMPKAQGVGVDRSEAALAVARKNAAGLGLENRAQFLVSDWGCAVEGPFDILIANPPYIREGAQLPADVSDFEPSGALFAGTDGLAAYRVILADVARLLAPGGLLIFECGAEQAEDLAAMVSEALPGAALVVFNDLKGLNRGVLADVSGGRKTFTKKD